MIESNYSPDIQNLHEDTNRKMLESSSGGINKKITNKIKNVFHLDRGIKSGGKNINFVDNNLAQNLIDSEVKKEVFSENYKKWNNLITDYRNVKYEYDGEGLENFAKKLEGFGEGIDIVLGNTETLYETTRQLSELTKLRDRDGDKNRYKEANKKIKKYLLEKIIHNSDKFDASIKGENKNNDLITMGLFKNLVDYGDEAQAEIGVELLQRHWMLLKKNLDDEKDREFGFFGFEDIELYQVLMDRGEETVKVNLKESIEDLLNVDYKSRIMASRMISVLSVSAWQGENQGVAMVKREIEKIGLDPEETYKYWIESCGELNMEKTRTVAEMSVTQGNLETMFFLEEELPGSCKFLKEKYNITNFGRYPKEVLIKQCRENNDKDNPFGILIYAKADHSGAFSFREKQLIEQLDEDINLNKKVNLRIFEAGSKWDLARILIKCKKWYGEKQKISFALLGAHGSDDSITLGFARTVEDWNSFTHFIFKGEIEKIKSLNRVGDFFEKNAQIILASCSTGKENGIGQKISEALGTDVEVVAPDRESSVNSIKVDTTETVPKFKTEYDGAICMTYLGGQLK